MYAPVHLGREEGTSVCLDGSLAPNLTALDFAILERWSARMKWADMSRQLGISVAAIKTRAMKPAFQDALARLQRNWFDQLARGEFGALAIAKANAVGSIKRILRLARGAYDERVRLKANEIMLNLAGVVTPKPVAIERVDTLIQEMTPEELIHFSETNEFPRRLHDKLARVAAGVLQSKKRAIEGTVDVEWEHVAGDVTEDGADDGDADTAPAQEIAEDDDTPDWQSLPDETALPEKRTRRRKKGRRAA